MIIFVQNSDVPVLEDLLIRERNSTIMPIRADTMTRILNEIQREKATGTYRVYLEEKNNASQNN